jgi:hypothetical protein
MAWFVHQGSPLGHPFDGVRIKSCSHCIVTFGGIRRHIVIDMNRRDAEPTRFVRDNNSGVTDSKKKSTPAFGKGCIERRDVTKKAHNTTRTRAIEQRWIHNEESGDLSVFLGCRRPRGIVIKTKIAAEPHQSRR